MKFAFGEFHLWYQVALSMVACGKVRPRARWGLHTPPQRGLGAPLSTHPSQSLAEAGAMIQKYCPAMYVNLQGMRGTKGGPQTLRVNLVSYL